MFMSENWSKKMAKFDGLEPRGCKDINGLNWGTGRDLKSFGTLEKQAPGRWSRLLLKLFAGNFLRPQCYPVFLVISLPLLWKSNLGEARARADSLRCCATASIDEECLSVRFSYKKRVFLCVCVCVFSYQAWYIFRLKMLLFYPTVILQLVS